MSARTENLLQDVKTGGNWDGATHAHRACMPSV